MKETPEWVRPLAEQPRAEASSAAPIPLALHAMARSFKVSTKKVGLAPGAVVFTGKQKVDVVRVGEIRFGPDEEFVERRVPLEEIPDLGINPDASVQWINVFGLHDTALIQTMSKNFGVHPLAMEDIAAVGMRPILEEYDGFLFGSLKMLSIGENGLVVSEHVSLITGPGWVLSFQERPGDVFEPLRERLRSPTTRIRERGADYLWYALMDAVVDNYLLVLDALANQIDELEGLVWTDHPPADIPSRVQLLRDEVVLLRRAIRPFRDELDTMLREFPVQIEERSQPFFKDLQDHIRQSADLVEAMRDSLSSIMDAHLSMVSMRTNEVMKVLTIMASIFIPLTFIAGIYGMNFQYMPELGVRWGYFAVWGVMIVTGVGMMVYFRKKHWL